MTEEEQEKEQMKQKLRNIMLQSIIPLMIVSDELQYTIFGEENGEQYLYAIIKQPVSNITVIESEKGFTPC